MGTESVPLDVDPGSFQLASALGVLAQGLGAQGSSTTVLVYRVRDARLEAVALCTAQGSVPVPSPWTFQPGERALLLPLRTSQSIAQTVTAPFHQWLNTAVARVAISPLRNPDGALIGGLCALRAQTQGFSAADLTMLEVSASLVAALTAGREAVKTDELERVVAQLPLFVVEADGEGNVRGATGGALETLRLEGELSATQLRRGGNVWELFPESTESARLFIEAYAGREEFGTVTWRGRSFDVYARPRDAAVEGGTTGDVDGIVAVGLEVTESLRLRSDLKSARNQLSRLLSTLPVLVLATDAVGVVTLAEGMGLAPLEARKGTLVGSSLAEVIAEEPELVRVIQRALSGERFECTVGYQGLHVRVFVEPLYNDSLYAGSSAIIVDISDQVRAERERQRGLEQVLELEAAHARDQVRAEEILGTIREGVLVVDGRGTVVHHNRAALALLDRPSQGLIGFDVVEVLGPAARSFTPSTLPVEREDGSRATLEVSAYPAQQGSLFVLRDITVQLEREREGRIASTIADTVSQGLAVLAPDLHVEYANAACGEIAGVDADALIGANLMALVHPDDRVWVQAWWVEGMTEQRRTYWHRLVRADGEVRTVEVTVTPRLKPSGTVENIVLAITDLTERRALEAFKEEQNRREGEYLRALASSIAQGLAIVDSEGRVVFFNAALQLMLGAGTAKDGTPLLALVHPEERARLEQLELSRTNARKTLYTRLRGDEGRELRVEIDIHPMIQDGRFEGASLVVNNMTEVIGRELEVLRQTNAALEAERALVTQLDSASTIMNTVEQGMIVTDHDARIIYANPALATLTGHALEHLVGLEIMALIAPESRAEVGAQLLLRRRGRTARYTAQLLHANGTALTVDIAGYPRLVNGEFKGSAAVITPSTVRDERERALQTALQEQGALLAQTTLRAERLAVLGALHDHLAACTTAVEVARATVEAISSAAGIAFTSIYFLNGDELRLEHQVNYPEPLQRFALDGPGIMVRVVRERRGILVRDTRADTNFVNATGTIRSEVAVPLLGQAGVLGVLNIESERANEFDDTDLEALTQCAARVSEALNRTRLIEALRLGAGRLRDNAEALGIIIGELDVDGRITHLEGRVGVHGKSMLGQRVTDLYAGNNTVLRAFATMRGGEYAEFRLTDQNGTVWAVEGVPRWRDGHFDGARLLMRDTTHAPERDARARQLEAALEQTHDFVLITESGLGAPGPRIVYTNRALQDHTGYSQAELLGATPRLFQGERTSRELLARLKETLSRGEPFVGSTVNYRKDGSSYFVEWRITPVLDEAGRVTHFVSVQRDISQRLRLERLLDNVSDATTAPRSELAGAVLTDPSGQRVHQLREALSAALRKHHTLHGAVETVGGTESLLQLLNQHRASGRLAFEDGASLSLRDGRIVAAHHPDHAQARHAALALLARERGAYRFESESATPSEDLDLSPTALSMELTRVRTEARAQPDLSQLIVLPDVHTALQFVAGVGGASHFTAAMERDEGWGDHARLVLRGRGFIVVVVRGALEDVAGQMQTHSGA
jgi:PAS domain S-box-containing protein